MKSIYKWTGVGLASLLALAGCGGGGGGGGGGTPDATKVALSGSAAKGILIGAEVNVYNLSSVKLGTTTTDELGRYTLNIAPTNDPVVIEVKALASTQMLDETGQLTADGKFPKVEAPKGLTMRSFAANASQETVVRVNPLTEMAVAVAAGATGGLSINNLIAGQQVAQLAAPAGVNPFTQDPMAEPGKMDDDQFKFAIKMAGLMSLKSDTCALQCQIDSLSKDVKFELASDGKATFSEQVTQKVAEKSLSLLNAGATTLTVNTNQVEELISTAAVIREAAQNRVTNPVALVTAKPEEVLAANGLQGFVEAMRNGFRLTETRLLKVEKELEERYKDVTLEGVNFIGNVLDEIEAACSKNTADRLSCTSDLTRAFTWKPVNLTTFDWETKKPNSAGLTSTGRVVVGTKNDMDMLTVNGRILNGTTVLATMNNLEVSWLDKGDADYRATVNGSVTANDNKNLVVTLKFDGIDLKSVPRGNPALADLTFKGGLSIEANNGDKLSGTIDLTGVEFAKNMNFYTDYQQYITAGTINLKAVTASTNVLGLDLSVKTSMPDYTKPQSRSNYETMDGTFKLALTDSLSLSFNESSKAPESAVQAVTIKSGTSEVKLSAEYKEAPRNSAGWCQFSGSESGSIYRCATEIKLTSSNANPYTATLKRVNGKTTGDILLGTTKVGEFVNGVMKINGAEVSLY